MSYSNNFRSELGSVAAGVKRTMLLAMVVGSMAGAVRADQLTTAVNFGPWQAGAGGEFTVTPDAALFGQIAAGLYSPFTMNQVAGRTFNFQTFCLERNEYITPNTTFDVTLNSVTIFTGNPLSAGAAYLYSEFARGTLTDINGNSYNYTDTPAGGRTTVGFDHALMLQNAIWYLMDPAMMGGQAGNPFVLKADQVLGGSANSFAPDNGAHGVSVMNLWTPGQPHDPQHTWQDLLVLTIPEPSALAIFSVATLLLFRRRK